MEPQDSTRLALVISSLDAGGAERVMSIMANYWASRGCHITLVTIAAASTDFYSLHPSVTRVALGVDGYSRGIAEAVANNARRIRRLRLALRNARPAAVISFVQTTNVLALIAGTLEGLPVIVSERSDPLLANAGPIWNGLRRMAYPHADALVVQTPEVRRWAERFLPDGIVHTIPNPVLWPPAAPKSDGRDRVPLDESPRVLAAGRLDPLKGFDVLLQAFAKCRELFPDWKLTIVGEGPERARLEDLALQLALTGTVDMPGRVQYLHPLLRAADLFVLSSRSEGFPNVLLEAMASGVAVVATDCPSGPRHIVRDGIDGLLVAPESVESLAAAMCALMGDAVRRRALASRAEEVRDRFSVQRVMGEWERLIHDVAPAAWRSELS